MKMAHRGVAQAPPPMPCVLRRTLVRVRTN